MQIIVSVRALPCLKNKEQASMSVCFSSLDWLFAGLVLPLPLQNLEIHKITPHAHSTTVLEPVFIARR